MRPVSTKNFKKAGLYLFLIGLSIALIQYYPIIRAEFRYQSNKLKDNPKQEVTLATIKTAEDEKNGKKYIFPEDRNFGLVIPKLGINVPIIEGVDPYDPEKYQQALAKGVAHVRGTTLPEDIGNTVLFAHSSDNFYNANMYNAIFYLLNKLEMGDEIYLVHKQKIHKYEVAEKVMAKPKEINYMENSSVSKLTLITCWPPGTTFKRLVVVAKSSN
jgi:sortase A